MVFTMRMPSWLFACTARTTSSTRGPSPTTTARMPQGSKREQAKRAAGAHPEQGRNAGQPGEAERDGQAGSGVGRGRGCESTADQDQQESRGRRDREPAHLPYGIQPRGG